MNDSSIKTDIDKEEALRMLRKAKSAHIKWRFYAQGMVAGLDIPEDKTPMQHTDCLFGKWYYGTGQQALSHFELYKNIEVPHQILHQIYGEIFQHIESGQTEKAKERLPQLVEISKTLLETIDLLEQEITTQG